MSRILEFSIEADAFRLGRVLKTPPGVSLELERIVPTGSAIVPFVWVTGEAYDAFERSVRSHPAVESLTALDRNADHGLYRLDWDDSPTGLLAAMAESEAVILEAKGDETWTFRLRFASHDDLAAFHDATVDQNIPLHVTRTTLTEGPGQDLRLGLTREQRDALVLALRRGYFASPSEVQLDELAAELGISRQAVSKRIRRGNEKTLESVLLDPATDSN